MFKVEDEVVDWTKGEGVVINVRDDFGLHLVVVRFTNGEKEEYINNGLNYSTDINPSLYHKGTKFIVKPVEPIRGKFKGEINGY